MRGPLLRIVALLGLSVSALGQARSSDAQTLEALLSEVRALRQELRVSLNRAQNTQILLARLQIQEGVITRAADRLNQARQKLSDTQIHQKGPRTAGRRNSGGAAIAGRTGQAQRTGESTG